MKICIVTVYNSYNSGSFLQAESLAYFLKAYGEVIFLNTKTRGIVVPAVKKMAKAALKCKLTGVWFEIKNLTLFIRNMRKVKSIDLKTGKAGMREIDVFVFGSDEIWNVSREEFSKHSVFWGEGLPDKKRISYAVSINNALAEDLERFHMDVALQPFYMLGVRDRHSQKALEQIGLPEATITLDPTMLFTKDHYVRYSKAKPKESYIAVYLFGPAAYKDGEYAPHILKAAERLGKRLVSVGMWLDWCHESVLCENPFDYFIQASYVITNTFHGTAYAVNLEKKFISIAAQNNKVLDLLEQFNLIGRNATGMKENEIYNTLREPIDYTSVSALLNEKRKDSFAYLENALSNKDLKGTGIQ